MWENLARCGWAQPWLMALGATRKQAEKAWEASSVPGLCISSCSDPSVAAGENYQGMWKTGQPGPTIPLLRDVALLALKISPVPGVEGRKMVSLRPIWLYSKILPQNTAEVKQREAQDSEMIQRELVLCGGGWRSKSCVFLSLSILALRQSGARGATLPALGLQIPTLCPAVPCGEAGLRSSCSSGKHFMTELSLHPPLCTHTGVHTQHEF